MGISSKKQKTTETSHGTSDVTTTRLNPSWVEDSQKQLTGSATGLLSRNPLDFVSPANPLQTQAGAGAATLGSDWRSTLGGATDMVGQAAGGATGDITASSLLEGLNDYFSPYKQKVVDATLDDFDVDAGRTRAAQAASGARNGAFGGSRFAVREAQTEGELSRARASAEANLLDQGFSTAADLSDRDAGRRQAAAMANQAARSGDLDRTLSAGGLMGTLAGIGGSQARDDLTSQMGIGEALRGVDTEGRQAPIGLMGAVADLLAKTNPQLFSGTNVSGVTDSTGTSTTTSSGGLLGSIGQIAQLAATVAPMMSDERLKADVHTLGRDDRGRRWVSWRYLWEPEDAERHTGVMAQEIEASDPDAVHVGPMGFLMVDYSKLGGASWLHS